MRRHLTIGRRSLAIGGGLLLLKGLLTVVLVVCGSIPAAPLTVLGTAAELGIGLGIIRSELFE